MSSDLKIGVLLNFFLVFFFLSFLRSTLDEINTKRYVKNYGGFFGNKREKRRKNTVHMEEKKIKKKKRPGRDSNPRSSVLSARVRNPHCTRPTPYHLATEPQRMKLGGIRIIESNNHNALCTTMFVTAQQHYYSSTWKYWTYSFIWIVHLWN